MGFAGISKALLMVLCTVALLFPASYACDHSLHLLWRLAFWKSPTGRVELPRRAESELFVSPSNELLFALLLGKEEVQPLEGKVVMAFL